MTARDEAIPVYLALRDAGPAGLSRSELPPGSMERIAWLRAHGVGISYQPPALPGDESRFVLVARLPDAWEQPIVDSPF